MQVPEFWRAPNNKLYRIKRERRSLEDAPGALYTIRAYRPGDESTPLAEAAVTPALGTRRSPDCMTGSSRHH